MAEKEQERARAAFQARQYDLAFKFTNAARRHAEEAGRIVLRHGGYERLARELERTDSNLERAEEYRPRVNDERIRELFRLAANAQRDAWEAFRVGRYLYSLKMTLAARELLFKAIVFARGETDPEVVEQALDETDRLIAEWEDVIRTDGDDAIALLDGAVERQQQARELYVAERFAPALKETNTARRMLKRAIELAESEESGPAGTEGP